MAKVEPLDIPYSNAEFLSLLNRIDNKPIDLYADTVGNETRLRVFPDEARRVAWLNARDNDEMTPEIESYQLGNFKIEDPYNMTVAFSSNEQVYLRYGDTGNNIQFTFATVDAHANTISESVEVTYLFNNAGSVSQTKKIYNSGTSVSMNIDDYISIGTNVVTITVKGRSTGASTIRTVHYYVVKMDISTSFNVAVPQSPNTGIIVPFSLSCSSVGVKYVQFYIDGTLAEQMTTIDSQTDSSVVITAPSSGMHHMQIRAYVEAGDGQFFSKTLYREFVVTGQSGIFIMLSLDLPSGLLIDANKTNLVLAAEQYVQSNITWGYYNSTGKSGTVKWMLGGENIRSTEAQVTDAESNATPYILSFVPTQSGTQELRAEVGGVSSVYSLVVSVNSSNISEATNGLKLKLQGVGRANNEPKDERNVWQWENIKAQFPTDFAWSEKQGWSNYEALAVSGGAQVVIPFAPLSNAPHNYGATFEIEFETYDVDDENAVVCSIWGNNADGNPCGIKITAEGCNFQSADGLVMHTQFKKGERIKLAFVVNRVESAQFPHIAMIYKNGVYERAIDYGVGGSYTNSSNITIGDATRKAAIKVYNIRSYHTALTIRQELYNAWIDGGDIARQIIRNDIYEGDIVSVEKMQGVIPVMLIDGLDETFNNITTLEKVKDKNTKINVNVQFFNPSDTTKNFTINGARMKLQGTSSLGYPRKNFKLYSKKDNAVMYDFEGNKINKGLYAFTTGDVPVNTWTLKADFMDSSCTRNASVARIFGDIEPKLNIKNTAGDDALKTPPQLAAQKYESVTGVKFPFALRTTPNAQAIVMFHKLPGDNQYTFLGQYTMLNDKGNEYVYGFHSIYVPTNKADDETIAKITADPMAMWMKDSEKDALISDGKIRRLFDNEDVHCYEILDNVNEFSNFNTVDGWLTPISVEGASMKHCGWEAGFESRYPEIDDDDYLNENLRLEEGRKQGAPLKAFIDWMLSCYTTVNGLKTFNITKFENEMEYHLNLFFCAAYYVYLIRWGAVDQVKKNMMWTTYGERSSIPIGNSGYDNLIWFPIRYDNDSTADTRNDGSFFYNYRFMREDLDPSTQGAYYYSGHDSLLWNALEQSEKFRQMVVQIDTEFYASGLTYENVIHYYNDLARSLWCQSIYNENMYYKYIAPLLRSDETERADYLGFLHGDDEGHQKWWFRNRFDTIDAKWGTGEFANKYIHILCPAAPTSKKIYIIASKDTSFGLVRNKVAVEQDNGEFTKTCQRNQQIYLNVNFSSDSSTSLLAIGDPLYINGANNIDTLDLHEFAPYFAQYLEFDRIYDAELGSNMKVLRIGISDTDLANGVRNTADIPTITGIDVMTRLETLDMKGLTKVVSMPFLKSLTSLKYLYLKETGLSSFTCADGVSFTTLQLPAGMRSMELSRVNWTTLDYTPTNTLRTIKLDYMNEESKFGSVKTFVFAWLDALETTYGMTNKWTDFSLRLTGIDWTGVAYHRLEQLANLGQCVLSGHSYIKCATEFTSTQMTFLLNKFGDSVFTTGSDLIIDCVSQNLILGLQALDDTVLTTESDGVISFYETKRVQVIATGFGNLREETSGSIRYNFTESSTFGVSISQYTGIITSTEEGYDAHELTIYAYNTDSLASGSLKIRIKPLSYPTSASIWKVLDADGDEQPISDGSVDITSSGMYRFFRKFTPGNTTGSLKNYAWNFSGNDSSKSVEASKTEEIYTLNVKSVEGETYETLVYWASFKNAAKDPSETGISSPALTINLFSEIDVLFNNNIIGGNEALYAIIAAIITPKTANRFSSAELRSVTGSIVASQNCGLVTFKSINLNVLSYLKNVTSLDVHGVTTLNDDADVTKMTNITVLNLEQTAAGCTFGDI